MITLVVIGFLMTVLAFLYAMILLMALSGLSLPGRSLSQPVQKNHVVSVVIPVRNEEHQIVRCLESILLQDYDKEGFEVLISDDFSEDKTLDRIHGFIRHHPQLSCNVLTGEETPASGGGKKRAIERAIASASGTLILTTDADTRHTSRWISSMVSAYNETGTKMVLGPVMYSDEHTGFQKIQTLEFLGVMGLTAGFASLGRPVMCNGANLLYEKEAFLEVGGFGGNEAFVSGDDQFLLWKIKSKFGGRSIHFHDDPDAIVTTFPEHGLGSFLQQRLRWISKSRGYRDLTVLSVGAVSYLFQAMILAGFLLIFLSPIYLYLALSLLSFKLLVDFPLVYSMARFFGKRRFLWWYIPAQLFQVMYVTVSGLIAFVIPVRWKGRRV